MFFKYRKFLEKEKKIIDEKIKNLSKLILIIKKVKI